MPDDAHSGPGLATRPPDVLVLGGGGVLGEAWMSSLLAGMEQAGGFDATGAGEFVGTSAGSIVATLLAAGIDPANRLGRLPEALERPAEDSGPRSDFVGALAQAVGGPIAALTLRSAAPGGKLVRRAALSRVPAGRRSLRGLGAAVTETGVSFDGRLRVCAVDLARGERVVFGANEGTAADVAAAVEASCAIPGVFRPVRIDGRDYVDGGVWSPTNLDAATAGRGAQVLCLNPTGSLRPGVGGRLGWIGPVSRAAAAIEAATVRRRGATVTVISPDKRVSEAIGGDLMRAGARSAVMAAGYAQGAGLVAGLAAAA